MVYPLVINMCKQLNVSPSKMMYPIAVTVVSTSFVLEPIGPYAAWFVTQNGYLESYGWTGPLLSMWSETLVFFPTAIVTLLIAIFVLPKMMPDEPEVPTMALEGATIGQQEALSPVREVFGYGVFALVVIGLMLGLPSWAVTVAGAATVVLAGVLTEKEALVSMNMSMVLLYASVTVMGEALGQTGAAQLIGDGTAALLSGVNNGYVIGAVFYIVSFFMTSFLYNKATTTAVADFRKVMALELESIFFGCKYTIPYMEQRGGGVVLNLVGTYGIAQEAVCGTGVLIESGKVKMIGSCEALQAQNPSAVVYQNEDWLLLPSFVNAHDHGRGMSSVSFGTPDRALELWLQDLNKLPAIPHYDACYYDGLRLASCGVGTVLHSHNPNDFGNIKQEVIAAAAGYKAAGIRSILCPLYLDQNKRIYYNRFIDGLPEPLKTTFAAGICDQIMSIDEYLTICLQKSKIKRMHLFVQPSKHYVQRIMENEIIACCYSMCMIFMQRKNKR